MVARLLKVEKEEFEVGTFQQSENGKLLEAKW